MKIYVNGNILNVEVYDDMTSIIKKYVVEYGTSSDLPKYYAISNPQKIVNGAQFELNDIRNFINSASVNEISESSTLETLVTEYSDITKPEIIILWVLNKYGYLLETDYADIEIETVLPTLSRGQTLIFFRGSEVVRLVKEYMITVRNERLDLQRDVEKMRRLIRELNVNKPIELSEFRMEELVLKIVLDLPENQTVQEIFDSLIVSEEMPFVMYKVGGDVWFKLYQKIEAPDEWVMQEPEEDGIFFKILNSQKKKIDVLLESDNPSEKLSNIGRFYSNGYWSPSNAVEIDFIIGQELTEEDIKQRFYRSAKLISYKIVTEKHVSIKGTIKMDDNDFNRFIFSDLIFRHPTMSYFLFYNEKSQLQDLKQKYIFFYEPNHHFDNTNSIRVSFIQDKNQKTDTIRIRLSKVRTLEEIDSFAYIFARLMSLYQEEKDWSISYYEKYYPSAPKQIKEYLFKVKSDKINKKTGIRLQNLQTLRPEIFQTKYPCQKGHQPYLIEGEDKANEIVNTELGGDKGKIINFPYGSQDYYACEPWTDEPSKFNFPGLRENGPSNMANYKEYPLVPCCFEDNQYEKKKSPLRKYLDEVSEDMYDGDYDASKNPDEIGHILKPKKSLPNGRYGEVPYYLASIIISAGYLPSIKGKMSSLPLLRAGVPSAPDSILHCLERAFNDEYFYADDFKRREIVRITRDRLATRNFAVAKQELYDYSDEQIYNLLKSDDYLEPALFVSLLEVEYNCNIFMYQVDNQHPNGSILIPRYSYVHLQRDIPENRRSVFIVKYQIIGRDYPFQCELIIDAGTEGMGKRRPLSSSFIATPLVTKAIEVLYDSNEVFTIFNARSKRVYPYGVDVVE